MTAGMFLSPAELRDAAFAFLTISSVGRYIRTAKEAAARSTLRDRLARGPERIPDLLAHARTLWRATFETAERDLPEWELAILLSMLGQTADLEVDRLLKAVAVSERANAAWLAALARRLLQERAENQSEVIRWPGTTPAWPTTAQNPAESRPERLVATNGLRVHSSEDQASQRILRVAA